MRTTTENRYPQQQPDDTLSGRLEDLQIASPCSADWDAMAGDAKRRFCGECSLHVHDLSAMTSDEALAFLAQQSGRTCVRLRRRADGRVLTQDCPVGFARVRAGARALRRRLAVCSAFLLGALWSCTPRSNTGPSDAGSGAVTGHAPEMGEPLMGDVCLPEDEERPLLGSVAPPRTVEPIEEQGQEKASPHSERK